MISFLHTCTKRGASLSEHVTNFVSAAGFYTGLFTWTSESNAWTKNYNYTGTGKAILDSDTWDFVILHQTTTVSHLTDITSLESLARIVINNVGYPFSFLFNMAHAPHPGYDGISTQFPAGTSVESSNLWYAALASYAQSALATPYISEVLPSGTALQNLRTLSFAASAGDTGYFANDSAGHLQKGIGLLAVAYANAYKLCQILGEKPKSFDIQTVPASSMANGDSVGVTDANKKLAQICAMMAVKKPFELTDCSVYE